MNATFSDFLDKVDPALSHPECAVLDNCPNNAAIVAHANVAYSYEVFRICARRGARIVKGPWYTVDGEKTDTFRQILNGQRVLREVRRVDLLVRLVPRTLVNSFRSDVFDEAAG